MNTICPKYSYCEYFETENPNSFRCVHHTPNSLYKKCNLSEWIKIRILVNPKQKEVLKRSFTGIVLHGFIEDFDIIEVEK